MAVNSVDKAISYDDDDSEERVGFRRGGSRRGGGRRGGRGGGGRRGSRSGRGGARRGSRSPRGNRARANRNKAKRSRTGRTTSRDKQVAGMRRDSARAASGQQTRRGTTTTSKDVSKEAAKKSSSVTSKSNQAQQEKANVTGGLKYNIDPKYSGNIVGAIMNAQKAGYERSLKGRQEQAAIKALQADEAKQVSPEWSSIRSKVGEMEASRENLLNKAKQNKISNEELNQLSQMNRDIGLNETTGMGLMESLKYQGTRPELKEDFDNLKKIAGSIPTPMNLIRKAIYGTKQLTQPIRSLWNKDLQQDIATGKFESGQERPGMFSGLSEGIGNFFGGLEIGPSGVENERRGGERRALNREGIYGGIDPLSSSAVARDASPLTTPAADPVNPTTGAIDYSNAMATSPALSNQMLSSPATLPTMAAQGTPYKLRDYYAGVLGQDPSIYQTAANGGRIGFGNGGWEADTDVFTYLTPFGQKNYDSLIEQGKSHNDAVGLLERMEGSGSAFLPDQKLAIFNSVSKSPTMTENPSWKRINERYGGRIGFANGGDEDYLLDPGVMQTDPDELLQEIETQGGLQTASSMGDVFMQALEDSAVLELDSWLGKYQPYGLKEDDYFNFRAMGPQVKGPVATEGLATLRV